MKKTILIIDDSSSLRTTVNITLTSAGYNVVEAENGKHALEVLGGNKVHLAICDVNMPVMDGIEFVRQVKQTPSHKYLPIIMLTTESRDSRKQEGREAGARAWVVKPFQPESLVDAVSKLILP